MAGLEKKFKIFYVANARIPTQKAHGVQILKMCEALAKEGADLTLILPWRFNSIKDDPFSYYNIEPVFKIKKLPAIDLMFVGIPLVFFLEVFTFSVSLFFYFLAKDGDYSVYTRGEMVVPLSFFLKKPIFWETHIKPGNFDWYKKAFEKVKGIIVVTKNYRDELFVKYNISKNKILYVPDGVCLKDFDINIEKQEARKKLGLPLDKKIIVYAGSFLKWKGVNTLIEAGKSLRDDICLYLVGESSQEEYNFKNMKFIGLRPYKEIPLWLKSADILILTGTAKSDISKYYTSPLKLFEYMASGRPIIAPKLPSFLDILNEGNAFLVEPANAEKLSEKIKFVLENKKESQDKAEKAHSYSKNYSWNKRAGSIIKFIKMDTRDL